MVTRKPVGPPLSTSPSKLTSNTNPLPYPTTPTAHPRSPGFTELDRAKTIHSAKSVYSPDLNSSPAFDLIDMNEARQRPQRRDSDVSSHGTWDSDDDGERHTPEEDARTLDVPKPLRISKSQQEIQQQQQASGVQDELPAILKPGPAGGSRMPLPQRKSTEGMRYEEEAQGNPWASNPAAAVESSAPVNNNPYRQQPLHSPAPDTSQNVWQSMPPANAPPPAPPVEMSTAPKTPADELSELSLGERQPRRPEPRPFETAEILAVPQQRSTSLLDSSETPGLDSSLPTSNPWRTPSQERAQQEHGSIPIMPPAVVTQQQYYPPPPGPPPKGVPSTSLIDHDDQPSYPAPSAPVQAAPVPISTAQSPPRAPDATPETPGNRAKEQRSEHYQIKHVNWYDASKSNMRRSPILTQNANGPCPLLALVNALILTTPQNLDTALFETLRTREQVSLGLLLDAVFDELMSGRRGDTAQELPDVGELYAFLLALHTGMNVNPCFVTPANAPRGSLDVSPSEKRALHPAERAQTKAGCFEETKEMRLYSTFNVPLIHGWTPPSGTPAYAAFERCAQTFEEAQNMQFLEPELEAKLREEGLAPEEQQTLQDIQTMRHFLSTWSTQLTDYGLETISSTMRPGQTAILFRNDHFSTIYKEPKHGALMTLVTDAGYGSHDEIVWESLVDVNGAASEMFSGDFRVVSHGQDVAFNQNSSAGGDEGWETVPSRRKEQEPQDVAPPLPGPRPQHSASSSADHGAGVQAPSQDRRASEQQDHDLALALQLQEEEEDQQRQADQRRRREQELSERFLSQSSPTDGPRPPIPPRRSNNNTNPRNSAAPVGRPAVNRPAAASSDPDAPPTYEQSRTDRPYRPAGATAQQGMQQGNPLSALNALRTQQGTSGGPPVSPRRQSQLPNGNRRLNAMPGTYGSGSSPQQQQQQQQQQAGGPGRNNQAAGVRDAEDKRLRSEHLSHASSCQRNSGRLNV
ncbi:hypothetical protein LTR17_016314 [Elasticomyces elasticus]|nr:hypothetical protein LTR17_016314 [Elasticomyces elasticus]